MKRKRRGTEGQAVQIQQAPPVKADNNGGYMFVGDVMEVLQISNTKAYQIMRKLNDELKEQGFLTVSGRVPTKYFKERMYC